jgi:hypothetical protein
VGFAIIRRTLEEEGDLIDSIDATVPASSAGRLICRGGDESRPNDDVGNDNRRVEAAGVDPARYAMEDIPRSSSPTRSFSSRDADVGVAGMTITERTGGPDDDVAADDVAFAEGRRGRC